VTNKVTFNDNGIVVYEDGTEGPQLYYYKDILPDKAGDACGMWYENIVVPGDLGMEDNNCCFIWKKMP
jgi:hypothetical protein